MLDNKIFLVRERVGFMKLSDTYDIFNPETSEQVGIAQERPGTVVHMLRFLINKQMLPTQVFVYQGSDPENAKSLLFSIRRGITLFRSRVEIVDGQGTILGWFQSKLFSMGGAFRVFNAQGAEVALVKGDWKGWNFRFLSTTGQELGTITKKWGGLGKELFTSADNYVISLGSESNPALATLLIAAGLAVDTVYKERG